MAREINPAALTESLDRYFAGVASRRQRRGLPTPQVLVRTSEFEYASGDRAMPFHAASIGKLATAALVMQEVEAGRLELSRTVKTLLPAGEIHGLFASPDAPLEQLLAHTSGVADYFEGKVSSGPTFIELVTGQPAHHWEPSELLTFSRERQRPIAEPGRRFAYSDTGHVVLDRVEVSGFASLTCDWAGGGIVTTLDDLTKLVTALSDGTLVRPKTWGAMTDMRHRFRPGIHYVLVAMELRFEGFMPLLRGFSRPLGHIGVLGTHAFIDPTTGATVALNFHSTREMIASFQAHIRIQQGLARLR